MNKYKYYITYAFTKDGSQGIGSCSYSSDSKPDCIEKIRNIANRIAAESKHDAVEILNWKRLKGRL